MNIETKQTAAGGTGRAANAVGWTLAVGIAAAFVVTGAVPKLTGDPISAELFSRVGGPAFSVYVVGVIELVAAVMILVPRTRVFGAMLAAGAMVGAIGAHVATPLGITPEFVDPATGEAFAPPLFAMAVGLLIASVGVLAIRRREIPVLGGVWATGGEPEGAAVSA